MDRRKHRRTRQWLQVRLDPGEVQTVTSDLGPGGVFIHTDRRTTPGMPVRLVIELPRGDIAVAEGIVRWTKTGRQRLGSMSQRGVGVEFTRVSAELQEYLDDDCPFILQAV